MHGGFVKDVIERSYSADNLICYAWTVPSSAPFL